MVMVQNYLTIDNISTLLSNITITLNLVRGYIDISENYFVNWRDLYEKSSMPWIGLITVGYWFCA